jgi:hypothetical protein
MHHIEVFLGVFEKSRKAIINFFMSVRPYVRVKQLVCVSPQAYTEVDSEEKYNIT